MVKGEDLGLGLAGQDDHIGGLDGQNLARVDAVLLVWWPHSQVHLDGITLTDSQRKKTRFIGIENKRQAFTLSSTF